MKYDFVSDDIHKDTLSIDVKRKYIEITSCVDCCGNVWKFNKKDLLEMIK